MCFEKLYIHVLNEFYETKIRIQCKLSVNKLFNNTFCCLF